MKTKKTNVSAKAQVKNISDAFLEVFRIGCKNKKEGRENIMELLAKANITKTNRGATITPEMVMQQTNNIFTDINKQRGRWKNYKVLEERNRIQIQ